MLCSVLWSLVPRILILYYCSVDVLRNSPDHSFAAWLLTLEPIFVAFGIAQEAVVHTLVDFLESTLLSAAYFHQVLTNVGKDPLTTLVAEGVINTPKFLGQVSAHNLLM